MVWHALLGLYLLAVTGMAVFGVHSGWLLWRSRRPTGAGRPSNDTAPARSSANEAWPMVTVQLPIYNERYVAERAIRAAAALEWPRERLQIQVLDDSTDDTVTITEAVVGELRGEGFDIEHCHRKVRSGYKAGALAEAMPRVRGEFVAVFDADFAPSTDWLRKVVIEERVFADPRTGFAQTRWSYLNREHNVFTRAQGMMHDVHFYVEQPVRCAEGLWFNFNGSGGLWRKRCIDDAGGWQPDTLTEDLDLSYRAAIRGWRGEYRGHIEAANELPERVLAFKRQQARWARGSIQTARKLLGPVWKSKGSVPQKVFATVHLCGYIMHPLLLIFIFLWPVISAGVAMGDGRKIPDWAQLLAPSCLGFLLGFPLVQRWRGRAWSKIGPELLLTLLVGVGVSASNTLAVMRGLFVRDPGEFVRTPKTGDQRRNTRYRLGLDYSVLLELAMLLWLTGWALELWWRDAGWWCVPAVVYAFCFAHFILRQAWESYFDRARAKTSAQSETLAEALT